MEVKENEQKQTISLLEPPTTYLDVTQILQTKDPLRSYCDLLLSSVNIEKMAHGWIPAASWSRAIWEATLVNIKAEKQVAKNWNGGRKSLYLVAYAVP